MIVSLCMIAFNEANALDGLFKDISLQEYPHEKIEVVFVDSMSTDATHAKMEVTSCALKSSIPPRPSPPWRRTASPSDCGMWR